MLMQKILRKFKNKRIIVTGHTGFKDPGYLFGFICVELK